MIQYLHIVFISEKHILETCFSAEVSLILAPGYTTIFQEYRVGRVN